MSVGLLMGEVPYVAVCVCAVKGVLLIGVMSSTRARLEHRSKRFGGTSVCECVCTRVGMRV